jgi:transposase
MLPQASGDPAEMRAPRDLLRRRIPLMRQRAELLAHGQQTTRQDHLPEIGKHIAYTANRLGGAGRFADPAVHQSIDVDFALITSDDELLSGLEVSSVQRAKRHEANTFSRLRSLPGVGKIVARVRRDEIHESRRFPRVQDVVSSCRLVTCAQDSAGKRYGTAGTKIGNADRQWACSAAAVLFLRHNPAGPKWLAR